MLNSIRWIVPAALFLSLGFAMPSTTSAETAVRSPVACTDGYMACLNASYDKRGIARAMADVECFARYGGCIARALTVS